MKLILRIATLTVLFIAALAASARAQQVTAVSGRITSAAGRPVSGASVTLESPTGNLQATSDTSGAFTFP